MPPGGRTGLTLIETTAVIGLSLILSLVLLEISAASMKMVDTINGLSTVQVQLTLALDTFAQDARLAVQAPATYDAYTQDLDSTDGQATLILQIYSIDGSGAPIQDSFDYVVYTFDGATGVLQRIVSATIPPSTRANRTQVVARDISSIQFNVASAGEVVVTVVANKLEGGRTFTTTLTAQCTFRNAA